MAPVFILGFPRSGTTAMADGIEALGRHGRRNVEGHLLHHFMPGLELLTKGQVSPASIVADPARRARFLADFTRIANATFSPRGDPADTMWIDKTPDIAQVRAISALARLWPAARFVFLYRPPVEAIRSNLAVFPAAADGREAVHAERWAALHRTWRGKRAGLDPEAFLEVYHPDMKTDPVGVASAVARFLGFGPEDARRLGAFWRDNPMINRPTGDRSVAYEATTLASEAVAAVHGRHDRGVPPLAQAVLRRGGGLRRELMPTIDPAVAAAARAWPFEEAKKVVDRLAGAQRTAIFETGYGPSGLPHIGTFGEVARTTMVRRAFEALTGGTIPTRLIAFSDDMDGMRKIPPTLPNAQMLVPYLGQPLTSVPDPFGTHESFAHHNNARLRSFLDQFGFEYEFLSATETYRSGRFDAALLATLRAYDEVMAIMLPTLGAERQATYSPFLPVHPESNVVEQVPLIARDPDAGTITWKDASGRTWETPVTGGAAKLQWKPDWAMRWAALGVDYEMAGKDLIDSVKVSSQVCRVIGGRPPEGFNYELFLDENGEKISKTRGNGLSVEEWLTYASPESLSLFMFQKPRAAKRLFFDVIPKAVDEYASFAAKYNGEDLAARLENPVWHISGGAERAATTPISFAMLLNLVSASNAEDHSVLWGFISRYAPGATAATEPELDRLVGYALAYYRDFVLPAKQFRTPTAVERQAIEALSTRLEALEGADGETIQAEVYAVGKAHFPVLREWFAALYQVLLGQEQGPRFGSFVALYGVPETQALIRAALAREPAET